jgi:chorismate mutase
MSADTNPQETAITDIRRQIDGLDDKIVELLIERIGMVARVGQIKTSAYPGRCPIRAGREADMVRRIIAKFQESAFDPAAAAAIWRTLIGSSTCVESPLTVSVFAPMSDEALYWLGREYFGPTVTITRQPHVNRVISDVITDKTMIGIVPILESGDANGWWTNLLTGENPPKIFAHIPFVYSSAATPAAIAIARIEPESTDSDVSFFALDVDHNVSQSRLQQAFAQAKIGVRWVSILASGPSSRRHLIELQGFIRPDDALLKESLSSFGASMLQIHYLGAYAVPVVLKPNQPVPHAASAS